MVIGCSKEQSAISFQLSAQRSKGLVAAAARCVQQRLRDLRLQRTGLPLQMFPSLVAVK
jgi:hypothetical protein